MAMAFRHTERKSSEKFIFFSFLSIACLSRIVKFWSNFWSMN